MLKAFQTILVPVDFSRNTEVAVAKTLELADREPCVIHLLHVFTPFPFEVRSSGPNRQTRMQQWKERIEASNPELTVQCWEVRSSSVQRGVRQMAAELGADLIVIGQTASRVWTSLLQTILPMRLNERTGIPVLTVKPGALHNKTRTILVPITDSLPSTKMHALEILCRRGRPTIHLITFAGSKNEPSGHSASALLQAYQTLKSVYHCPVEYAVVDGHNQARAILQYAEKIKADFLLVYPEKETKVDWRGTQISDVLPSFSKVQVLAVQPVFGR